MFDVCDCKWTTRENMLNADGAILCHHLEPESSQLSSGSEAVAWGSHPLNAPSWLSVIKKCIQLSGNNWFVQHRMFQLTPTIVFRFVSKKAFSKR